MLLKPEAPRIVAVYTFRMKSVGYVSRARRDLSETFLQITGKANVTGTSVPHVTATSVPHGTGTSVPHGTSVFLCQCHSTNALYT
jgi:hypothetical protein